MSSLLYRLGRWAYRAHRLVAAIWIAVMLLAVVGAAALSEGTDDSVVIPGTESQAALDQLTRTFPEVSGAAATIVVVAPDGGDVENPRIEDPVTNAVVALESIDAVVAVTSPYDASVDAVSDDGAALIVTVQFDGRAPDIEDVTREQVTAVGDALKDALPDGAVMSLSGDVFAEGGLHLSITEIIGLVVAFVVLMLTFGSFLAAGMPLITALVGVVITLAGLFAATSFLTISGTAPLLAIMLGLAVGIDYTLFIISRHQSQLREGMEPEESAARSVATAGSAVVFAGLTVVIALCGLVVANIPFLSTMGFAAAIGVAVAVLVALTFTPAMLGFAGLRVLSRSSRRMLDQANLNGRDESMMTLDADGPDHDDVSNAVSGAVEGERLYASHHVPDPPAAASSEHAEVPRGFFRSWVRFATRRPLVTVVTIIMALSIATLPTLSLRLALGDGGSQPVGSAERTTYDLLSEHFGAGYNAPLIVTGTIIGSTDPVALMNDIGDDLATLDGVESVSLATPNETGDTGIVQLYPTGSPDSKETNALVAEIRDQHDYFQDRYGVDLAVTGQTAVGIDVSARLLGALIPFGLLVVGLSIILLTMVFRSIWVPIKAAIGYVLSVGVSFGVVTAIYEWGWFADALNVAQTGPVVSFMPILLMGVLFGLAMDYEVFLVSRMREEYVHGRSARDAIEAGFVGSAPVVVAAAAIMFAVFAAFVPAGGPEIQPIAIGLAVGVFVDAFIVRMTLVPAVLQLLGEKAWYMPPWLDRLLPAFDVEGAALGQELKLADWPESDSSDAITAHRLRLDAPEGPLYDGITVRLPEGGVLLVEGGERRHRRALMLTLAGRMLPTSGTLKVAGLVSPVRAAAIRTRVAVIEVTTVSDLVTAVREAVRSAPEILMIEDLDAVSSLDIRHRVRRDLEAARELALQNGRPLTVVASSAHASAVADLLLTLSDDLIVRSAGADTLETTKA